MSRDFFKNFCRGREKKTYIAARYLRPPLRDSQAETPARLCPLCGEEQYRWERTWYRRGRPVCAGCAARLEQENEEEEPK